MLPATNKSHFATLPSVFLDEWPFDHLFKQVNGGTNGGEKSSSYAFDLIEYADSYVVAMDVPGVHKDDIELSMEGNMLSLRIERKEEATGEKGKYLHRSRWQGSTTRTLALPEAASGDEVEASLRDGVLTIHIHKAPEKQARKIEIKAVS